MEGVPLGGKIVLTGPVLIIIFIVVVIAIIGACLLTWWMMSRGLDKSARVVVTGYHRAVDTSGRPRILATLIAALVVFFLGLFGSMWLSDSLTKAPNGTIPTRCGELASYQECQATIDLYQFISFYDWPPDSTTVTVYVYSNKHGSYVSGTIQAEDGRIVQVTIHGQEVRTTLRVSDSVAWLEMTPEEKALLDQLAGQ